MSTDYNRSDLSNEALKAWQAAHPELAPDQDKTMKPATVNHDYDTPAQKAEAFREEIRQQFADLHMQIQEISADLAQIRTGLTQASQPAPAVGTFETMNAVKLIRAKSKGKWYYKMQGGQYMKQGVTIWDEVLELLDLDPNTITWNDEDIYKLPEPLHVKMIVKTYTDDNGIVKQTPQKVTGKA